MVRISALSLLVVSTLCLLAGTPTAFAQVTTYVGTYFESTITISNPAAGLPPCNFSTCSIQAIPGLPEGLLATFDAAGNVRGLTGKRGAGASPCFFTQQLWALQLELNSLKKRSQKLSLQSVNSHGYRDPQNRYWLWLHPRRMGAGHCCAGTYI
jgi:hypothetical protein